MTFPQRGERDNWHGSSPSEHAMFATNGGARPGPEAFVFKTDGAVLDVDVIFGKGPSAIRRPLHIIRHHEGCLESRDLALSVLAMVIDAPNDKRIDTGDGGTVPERVWRWHSAFAHQAIRPNRGLPLWELPASDVAAWCKKRHAG